MVDRRARPGGAGQVGGKAMVVAGIDNQRELAVQQVGHVGHRVLQRIHRERDMPAVEMAAMQDLFAFRVDQRIVVGAVEFGLDQLAQERQRVFQHADHMRCAAQRVPVLQPLLVARRTVAVQVLAQALRHARLAGMRLGGEQHRIEMVGIAVAGQHVERRQPGGEPRQVLRTVERQAGQRRHHRGAIHDGQAFLGAQRQRRHADLGQRLARGAPPAPVHDVAFAAQHGRHVRQRRQVAAGADRALGRDQGQHIVAQQGFQPFQQRQADAGHAAHQRRQARGEYRARLGLVQEAAQPAAVVRVKVVRQFRHQRGRDVDRARIAVAGGHAIDDALLLQQPAEEVRPARDACAETGIPREHGGHLPARQRHHVLDAQRCVAEDRRCGFTHCGRHALPDPRRGRS